MKSRFIFSLALLVLVGNLFAQRSEFLANTIIFKVKPVYRSACAENTIKLDRFQNVLQQIEVNELKKVFPFKEAPRTKKQVDLSLIYQLAYAGGFTEQEVINKLQKTQMVTYAERYVIPELAYTPNDTNSLQADKNWHLAMINAFQAWDITKGDTNVVIGITDTGWDPTHIDLLDNCKVNYNDPINGMDDDNDGYIDNYLGYDVANNDNDAALETSTHGDHVTGLAAAVSDNVAGVASVGFHSKFLPIKIANSNGQLTAAYQGVVYAADQGCFIINCSWGSYTPGQFQRDVINYATIDKGCLVIGACGNDSIETPFYPAAYDGVLTVAASEQSDLKKNNSNFGTYVDISAPGEYMFSTKGNGTWGYNGGTSMAAPVVAGAAALVKAQFPSYNNYQVAAQLEATAFDFYPNNPAFIDKLGSGRLDVYEALTNTSVQFLALTNTTVVDNNDEIFEENDTLEIVGEFTNYLSQLAGLTATLSSTSPYVNVVSASTNLPTLNTMDVAQNVATPFLVQVLAGASFNQEVEFKVEITNGTYTKNEFFTIKINPDYIHLEENQVSTTITSNGKIGHNDLNNSVGIGFTYNGKQLLYEMGLMVGNGNSFVSDCVRGTSGQDRDFLSLQNVKFNPPYISALDLKGKLNDSENNALALGLEIEHFAYAFPNSPDNKYVIVAYRVKNTSGNVLNNIHLGLFADWDIEDYTKNKSGYDAARKMGYAHSLTEDTLYAAIKLLTSETAFNYSLDNVSGGGGGVDLNAGFTTMEKFTTLSTNRLTAGGTTGNDVAHVVSSGVFNLQNEEEVYVAFAIIAGDSLSDIQTSADAAEDRFLTDAIGIEELSADLDIVVYPNPATNLIYTSLQDVNEIRLIDQLGRVVMTNKGNTLNVEGIKKGGYQIMIKTSSSTFYRKVIIQ